MCNATRCLGAAADIAPVAVHSSAALSMKNTPLPPQHPQQTARSRSLWFYERLSRLHFLGYRGKIMVMAFIGTHIPLIALTSYFALQSSPDVGTFLRTVGVTLVATLLGTGITLIVLNQLLRPVLMTSAALRSYRETGKVQTLPVHLNDEVGTLMADAQYTIDHLDARLDALEHVHEVTALPNHKRFLQLLEARIARGETFAVVALRFSNLSRVADTLDRGEAEAAARSMARRLSERAELGENLSHVTTAEFACTVGARKGDTSPWLEAAARVRTALAACAQEMTLSGVVLQPELHAGVAVFPTDAVSAGDLLDRALTAAAQAAQTLEPQQVRMHSAEARQAALRRFTLENELRRAIEQDEFELHYQPVVDVQAGRSVGGEALIRWRHPERGMVPPGEFIAAAEASGLIQPIGLWVMRRACAQVREWNDRRGDRLRVAINLSARQFLDPELKRHVLEAIEQNGISPDQLEIELTETAAMVDHDHTRRVFTSLRDAGVSIAIDDFGTGYASMSYLRKLPFDKLKIDREFVTDVHRVQHNQAICRALIELSRGLKLKVLAEGAETLEEVDFLARHGCELFQGFYFSRPVPAAQFEQAIALPVRYPLASSENAALLQRAMAPPARQVALH